MQKIKVGILKKILSFLNPQKIKKYSTPQNKHLELLLFKNSFLLCTDKAIYSDGTDYAPFKLSFQYIFNKYTYLNPKKFLLLGGGLCSASIILDSYNTNTEHTIVEHDETIVEIAQDLIQHKYNNNALYSRMQFHTKNVEKYLSQCNEQFDIIGIDLFKDLIIPPKFLNSNFIEKIKNISSNDSLVIFNWIKTPEVIESEAYQIVFNTFKEVKVIDYSKNIFVIAKPF